MRSLEALSLLEEQTSIETTACGGEEKEIDPATQVDHKPRTDSRASTTAGKKACLVLCLSSHQSKAYCTIHVEQREHADHALRTMYESRSHQDSKRLDRRHGSKLILVPRDWVKELEVEFSDFLIGRTPVQKFSLFHDLHLSPSPNSPTTDCARFTQNRMTSMNFRTNILDAIPPAEPGRRPLRRRTSAPQLASRTGNEPRGRFSPKNL